MKMDEIVALLLQHTDEYAVEGEEMLPGEDGELVTKKCKKIDVTLDLIIDFCYKNKLPLPDELIEIMKE